MSARFPKAVQTHRARNLTAAAAERKEEQAKSTDEQSKHTVAERQLNLGSSGVEGLRPSCFSWGRAGAVLFQKRIALAKAVARSAAKSVPPEAGALYELDALLGAGMMHCPNGIPEPMGSEYFWYDWGCIGDALERCGGAYHEVIIEHAAVALVTKVLTHLLDNSKVDAAMQRLMHFYLALVLFGSHALDDDEVFKDVMRQLG